MAYSEKVMDHFNHPRNVGEMENPSGVGTVGNAKCGDIMRMYLDIDDNGIIQEAKFKTFGCGAAVATSSMATELVKGKTIQEALEVTNKAVMEALDGLPPVKVHCSLLAEEAIHAALWLKPTSKRNNSTSLWLAILLLFAKKSLRQAHHLRELRSLSRRHAIIVKTNNLSISYWANLHG